MTRCSEDTECGEDQACWSGICQGPARDAALDSGLEDGGADMGADAVADAAKADAARADATLDGARSDGSNDSGPVDSGGDAADMSVEDAGDGARDFGPIVDQGRADGSDLGADAADARVPSDGFLTDSGQVADAEVGDMGPQLGPVDDLAGLYATTQIVELVEGGVLQEADVIHRITRLSRVGPGTYDLESRDSFGDIQLEIARLVFRAPEVDRYQFEFAFPVAGRLGCVEVRFERGTFEAAGGLAGRQTRETQSRGGDCADLLVNARLSSLWNRIGD